MQLSRGIQLIRASDQLAPSSECVRRHPGNVAELDLLRRKAAVGGGPI